MARRANRFRDFGHRLPSLKIKFAISSLGVALMLTKSVHAQRDTEPTKGINKPNIVFILMDNLGYGEVGCYGGGILRGAATPRIDKLASEGTRLLNFNVEPQCTPSR
jgi:Sulfatase